MLTLNMQLECIL